MAVDMTICPCDRAGGCGAANGGKKVEIGMRRVGNEGGMEAAKDCLFAVASYLDCSPSDVKLEAELLYHQNDPVEASEFAAVGALGAGRARGDEFPANGIRMEVSDHPGGGSEIVFIGPVADGPTCCVLNGVDQSGSVG